MLALYPWLQSNWEHILKQWQQNAMPHALLLEGPKGLGKLDFAKILAARVLCQKEGALPCGHCRSCHLFEGFHPDLIFLEPEEKSSVIKIDALRGMIEKIQQTSTCGAYQVVIIHPAEAMNVNCANALLKTLEEPPDHVIFLLVSHQAAVLPPTVLSRCQRLNFTAPSEMVSLDWLKTQVPQQEAEALLRISEYAPLRALDLAKRHFLDLRDDLIQDLKRITQEKENPVLVSERWHKEDLDLFFLAYLTIILDIFRILLNTGSAFLMHKDREVDLEALSRHMSIVQVESQLREIQEAREWALGHAHPNLPLLIERIFLGVPA